jgi:hypothetical protein
VTDEPAVVVDGDTAEMTGVGATVPVTVMVCAGDVWPATLTVMVADPGSSGNGPVDGGNVNVIEVSLQLVIVSFAPSYGAPQLVPP